MSLLVTVRWQVNIQLFLRGGSGGKDEGEKLRQSILPLRSKILEQQLMMVAENKE